MNPSKTRVPVPTPVVRGLLVLALPLLIGTCRLSDLLVGPKGALLCVTPVAPDTLRDSAPVGSAARRSNLISIDNCGGGELKWDADIKSASPWVVLQPDSGTVGLGPPVQVIFNPTGLDTGMHKEVAVVNSPAVSAAQELPLSFKVFPCKDEGISIGDSRTYTLTSAECGAPHRRGSYAKIYSFSGNQNDSVTVEVTAAFDGYVVLGSSKDSSVTPLATNDACLNSGNDPCIYYYLLPRPGTATYYIEVTSADSADSGTFTMQLVHPRPPALPDSLDQRLATDSTTPVDTGSFVTQPSIVIRAIVSDPDLGDTLLLEAEVKPVGTNFNSSGTVTGDSVLNGSPAYVRYTGLSDNTDYHWRVRAVDQTGRASGWVSFGGNQDPGDTDFSVDQPDPPLDPSGLGQFEGDTTATIGTGATARSDTVVVTALVRDNDPGDSLRLLVEIKPVNINFNGTVTDSSDRVGTNHVAAVMLGPTVLVNNTNYHWRARTEDQTGRMSNWVPFGGNADPGATDFRIQVPNRPTLSGINQYQSDGSTIIPQGDFANTPTVIFKGTVNDIDPGATIRLEVEVQPVRTAFTDTATAQSTPVSSGQVASVTVTSLAAGADYHWQARAVDNTSLPSASWLPFPGSLPDTGADFHVATVVSELVFATQPQVDTAGRPVRPAVVVAARDANHNVVTTFSGPITMAISTNPAVGTLTGTTTVNATAGTSTFTNLIIDKAGTGYRLRASTNGGTINSLESNLFNVVASPATQLVFTTPPPGSTQAGVNMSPAIVVAAKDSFLNTDGSFTGNVQLFIANNAGTPPGTLSGGGPITAVAGVAQFSSVSIDKVGVGYTLRAVSGSLIPDTTSAGFTITPAPATHLTYQVQPSDAPQNVAINPAIRVAGLDQFDNVATSFTGAVTLQIASGTGTLGAVVSGNGPINAISGVATFSSTSIDLQGNGYRLTAQNPSFPIITSNVFDITAGTVSGTNSTVQASPATITACSTGCSVGGGTQSTITVTARDAANAVVPGASVSISVTGTGNTTNPTGSVITNASGVATFTLNSTKASDTPAELKIISAVISSVSINQKDTVTVNPGPATTLAFTTQPGNPTIAGVAINSGTGVVVTARDQFGNTATSFVSTLTMVLGANPAGGVLSGTLTATPSSGVATFPNLRIIKAAPGYQLQANGGALTSSLSNAFTINPAPPIQLTWTRQPTTTQVLARVDSAAGGVQVTVQDSVGNTVNATNSITVALFDNPTGAILGGTKTRSAVAGVATFDDLTVNKVGTYTMIANATGLSNDVSASFDIVSGPVSASQSTVSAAPTTITASNGSSTSTITITARDAGSNPIQGATVVLSATGSGNTLTQPIGTTNASGVATGTLSSTNAAAKVVSATINTVAISQTATVTVSPAGVSAAQSTVSAAPTTITASNGASASTITITARDAFSNPIQGAIVVLAATGTGNTLTQPSGTTNASGVVTGNLSSTDAGAKVVSATINGVAVTQTATVTVNHAGVSAAVSTVSAAPATITASNGSSVSTITVTAKDAFSNPISGATVVLTATGTGNTLTQPSGTTNGSGVAAGTLSSTDQGSKVVSATINGVAITQTATVTVNTGTVSASQSTVSAAPTSITASNGSSASTITVTAKDALGNTIPGASVVLAATGSGNTLTQPGSTTDGNGVATGTLSSTGSGAKVVSATINGVAINQPATVTVNAAGVSAAQSTVSASPATIAASNGSSASTITVTARDGFNNPIQGAAVFLAATGTGNTLTQPSGTTNASGVATGTLSSTDPGSKVVSATINGIAINQTATVTVNTGTVSASQSTVSAAPTSITASNGSSATTITVTANDAVGNPIPSATVVLSATGSGNTLTQPGSTTDINGVATGTLSSTGSGAKVVSATINGVAITQTAPVTVTTAGVSAAQSTVTAAPATITASNGSSASTITVTARDAFNNPIQGATVVLAATGTGNTLTQPSGTTNASGVATGSLSSTDAEAKTVSATINGVAINQTPTVTVNPASASASHSTVSASPTTITASNGSSASTITVTALDVFDNPIQGATVVLSATGSGNTLTQPSGTTNASGVTTGTLSSTGAAAKVVSATINGVGITQTASVTVTAAGVSAAQSTVSASPTSISASNGSSASTITVTARDAFNNPIQGATVVLAATGTGNTLTQPSGTTNASGVATGTLSSTKAESKTVSATINGTLVNQTPNVTVTALSASQLAFTAQPTNEIAGATLTPAIQVTMQDAFGNTVTAPRLDVTVDFGNNAGGGTLSGTKTVKTGMGTGIATFSTLSIDKTGTGYTLTASAAGVTDATSNGFDITPAAAHHLAFIVQPSNTLAGGTISPPVVVEVQDQFNNRVTGATNTITIAIVNNPGTPTPGTLTGNLVVSAVAGQAMFSDLSIDNIGVGYTLGVTSNVTGATSDPFNIL